MNENVYISRLASFLPNAPVLNNDIENVLGCIGGRPSRIKNLILEQNQIRQRYYAIKEGQFTHTNAELMQSAIYRLFDEQFSAKDIELLSCGTSSPDQMMPSHTSLVHGLIKGCNPVPILSPAGVCCSGAHALEYSYRSILSGYTNNAICGGSELLSPLLLSTHFEEEYNAHNLMQNNPYVAFEKDFLRWMLSDGAGCALLTNHPMGKLSLKIEWVESISYANEIDVCMSQGVKKMSEGNLRSWKTMPPHEWGMHSIFAIEQDIKLLKKHVTEKAVEHILNSCKKHHLKFSDIDYFLPHISSMFFYHKLADKLKEKDVIFNIAKWFTNLTYVGNIGAASIFVMLEELYHSSKLNNNELIYLFIPESARFSYTTVLLKVVAY